MNTYKIIGLKINWVVVWWIVIVTTRYNSQWLFLTNGGVHYWAIPRPWFYEWRDTAPETLKRFHGYVNEIFRAIQSEAYWGASLRDFPTVGTCVLEAPAALAAGCWIHTQRREIFKEKIYICLCVSSYVGVWLFLSHISIGFRSK